MSAQLFDDRVFEPPPDGEDDIRPADTPGRLESALLSRAALRDLPNPEPLIGNVLDRGTIALLYGRWGTGKSFIALDWAASVATGRRWQGRPAEPARVLYVAAEGAHGMKQRIDAWETGWQTTIPDREALDVLPEPVNLTRPADVHELQDLVAANGYGLVVVDTLARCMVGGDENSAQDCGLVVDVLHRLRRHTVDGRGVVLGVHHTGKDGKTFRGSSVFEAGADTVYSVTADGAVITLNREKRKDGSKQDAHELRIDPVKGSESCVISVHRGGGQSERGDKLMSTFVQYFEATGATRAQLEKVAGMAHATFIRAFNDLVKCGDLVPDNLDHRFPLYRVASK